MSDVAAADQLPVDIKMRASRPVRVRLQPFPDLGILENVHERELRVHRAQCSDGLSGKPALGKVRRALHIEQHRIAIQLLSDSIVEVHSLSILHSFTDEGRTAKPRSIPEPIN